MLDAIGWLSLRRRDLTPQLDRSRTPTLPTNPCDPEWTTAAASAAPPDGALVILPGSDRLGPLLPTAPAVAGLVTLLARPAQHHGLVPQPNRPSGRQVAPVP